MSSTVVIVANLILSFLTAYFFGRKYKIGFWYSFLFCIFFGFLVGNIITLCSPLKSKPPVYERTTGNIAWATISSVGCLLCIIAAFSVNGFMKDQMNTGVYQSHPEYYTGTIQGYMQLKWIAISFAVGFALAVIYALDGDAKPKENLYL